ncbi:MAG: class II aldolase/adducin family protein, partial [Burkholderiaceae bacterium]
DSRILASLDMPTILTEGAALMHHSDQGGQYSSLVKANVAGQVVDGSGARVNPSGFAIHGAVHAARPEVECVIHLHMPWPPWQQA